MSQIEVITIDLKLVKNITKILDRKLDKVKAKQEENTKRIDEISDVIKDIKIYTKMENE